jgi:energy-coupling factor transport system permease protein
MAAQTVQYHASTWWLWAVCAAFSISIQANLVLVLLIIAVSIWIANSLIVDAKNWKSFLVMTKIAFFIFTTRVLLQIVLGVPVGNEIILRLPQVNLPDWISGLRIGGIVTLESLSASLNDSLRLSGLIVVIATAVSLTTTSRVIQQLPVAFHELGMVIIIAFTFLPHLFADVQRIRQASRWRGQETGRIRSISNNLVSICESALERSVRLAAALTVRGYGNATSNQNWRRPIYFGLFLLTFEVLRLLVSQASYLDALVLSFSALLIAVGIRKAGKSATRTKFRTESWHSADFSVIVISLIIVVLSTFTQVSMQFITGFFITTFALYIRYAKFTKAQVMVTA